MFFMSDSQWFTKASNAIENDVEEFDQYLLNKAGEFGLE